MKKLYVLCAASIVLFACGSSNNSATSTTKKVGDPVNYANTITAEDLKKDLYTYASDEFEGRETGQPGQKKAVEYIKNHYVQLGIASPITKDDYFQEVPLEVANVPEATIIVNGTEFNYAEDFVSVSSNASQTITADNIIYVGYGIEDENYSDYKNIDVKGKIVLVKSGEPQNEDGTYAVSGTKDASKWSNMRQEFASKRDAAKDKGAKALLYYNKLIFPMVAQRASVASGRMNLADAKDDMFFFFIGENLAKSLSETINDSSEQAKINTDFSLDFKAKSDQIMSENVVAIIKGSEKPNEIIVISAHLDHEGIKDGKVYNGADDDGSGTVAILEIAEAFQEAVKKGQGPKRSILFLHVTGEEKGLLGSRYYTDVDPILPLENTIADLNIDMIGRTDPKRKEGNRNYVYLIGSDRLSTDLHNISEEVNTKYCNVELDYTYNDVNDPNRYYYRSDHYNFAKNNVPVIFYFNGTHDDYHQPGDTPDKIEYDLLENRTRLVFHTAWELANRENKPVVDKATN